MVFWWILGGIVVLLLLILLLRVGVNITFGETLRIVAKVGPVKIPLVPAPEKKKKQIKTADKPADKEKEKPEHPEKKEGTARPTFRDIRPALPVLWEALKKALAKTRRRMRIDPMQLSVTFGGDDPAQLAQVYGWANTAMWTVMPQLERLLQMPDPHIHLEANFESNKTIAKGAVGISFRIGDLLSIVLTLAVPVLRWYMKWKKKPVVKQTENTQNA